MEDRTSKPSQKRNSRLYVTGQQDQATPREFFNGIASAVGGFDLDAAATEQNACCERYWTREQDGLKMPWKGRVWVNPPWRFLARWIRKSIVAREKGCLVAMLCPLRCNTRYWHELVLGDPRISVYALRGGLKFGDQKSKYPHPLVIVFFIPNGYALPPRAHEKLESMELRHLSGPHLDKFEPDLSASTPLSSDLELLVEGGGEVYISVP